MLNYTNDVQVYVYKCQNRSPWLEVENNGLKIAEQMIVKQYAQISQFDEEVMQNQIIKITDEEAFTWGRRLAAEEGIVAGISSGANMCAAAQIAARPEFHGKRIVTVMCSLGERYLSTPLFDAANG